ncbi:MAG: flagellar biosynthetic protein FliR [Chloroflexi bacterium]|nr:flagellar biosynthetic protein FliR [Chloroflexota bacterium]
MPLSPQYALNFLLMFVRITTIFVVVPVFNTQDVPPMVKIGFSALLTFILVPAEAHALPHVPEATWPFLLMAGQEVFTGVVIGFAAVLIFSAIQIAAGLAGLQIGFRAANLVDPFMPGMGSALDQFYGWLAVLIFFAFNGHHNLIAAMAKTFEVVPVGTLQIDSLVFGRMLALLTTSFQAAVQVSIPLIGSLLLADVALGLVARTVPQVNVFFVGLPIKMGVGIGMLIFTTPITIGWIERLLTQMGQNSLLVFVR